MDEIERQLMANAIARGTSWVPVLRYVIERDRKLAEKEYEEYVARLTHNTVPTP